jgi:diguanylate cyclase (GGDEF)-like protein/PAS domain S-box-containing protein
VSQSSEEKTITQLAAPLALALLDSLDSQIATINRDGVITYVNKAWVDFALHNGMPPERCQFVGTSYLNVCSGQTPRSVDECLADGDADAQRVYAGIQTVLQGEATEFSYDYPCHSPVLQRWYIMRIAKVAGNDEQYLISHHETTGSKRQLIEAKAALLQTTEHTQAILDHLADGVVTLNAQGMMESFNHAACTIFGYAKDEVIGRKLAFLVDRQQSSRLLEQLIAAGSQTQASANFETTGLRKTGESFPLSVSLTKASRSGESVIIALLRDVTQQHLDAQEIRRLAFFDVLTGLPNRRLVMDRLSRSIVMSGRTGKHCALMFLDLDHFKLLNDTMGHHVGDQLLQQVAQRLQSCVREVDSVARLGGDEFVVLLEELSDHAAEASTHALGIAHKILACLGQPYALASAAHTCTTSIGIAVYGNTAETVEDLLQKADIAMYEAKAAGRNSARFFDPAM